MISVGWLSPSNYYPIAYVLLFLYAEVFFPCALFCPIRFFSKSQLVLSAMARIRI